MKVSQFLSLIILLCLVFFSCEKKEKVKSHEKAVPKGWFEEMMPITIYFHSYWTDSRSGLKIESDSISIFPNMKNMKKIATSGTKYEELFSVLSKTDLSGPDVYGNPFVVDGGAMGIITPTWEKKFVNAFSFSMKGVEPDTINLWKYKKIRDYTAQLMNDWN